MKTIIVLAVVAVLACSQVAGAQGTPIYDRNYSGPMNVYGQPTYSVPPGQQDQAGQNSPPLNGVLPTAVRGAQSVGSYLWSYAPAPLRGVQSPYTYTPGQGQVIVNFVPGTP